MSAIDIRYHVTARDDIVLDFDSDALRERLTDFADNSLSDDEIRVKYFGTKRSDKYLPGDTRGWKLPRAREELRKEENLKENIKSCLYRPFDVRPLYYSRYMVDWPRPEVMRHMLAGENLGFISARSNKSPEMNHFFCSRFIMETKCGESTTQSCLFPLYLYPAEKKIQPDKSRGEGTATQDVMSLQVKREPNLNPEIIKAFSEKLELEFVEDGKGDLKETFGPEDIFNYAYAVFHSPTYRTRYAEFLKIDFPRLPLTSNKAVFKALAEKGAELVSLHLMESTVLNTLITKYPITGSNEVEKVSYNDKNQRVYIDKTQYFEGVPPEVWNFYIGGYQVCDKWLKDRKGRKLGVDDSTYYQKIVVALKETIRLMDEIDELIPRWPIE